MFYNLMKQVSQNPKVIALASIEKVVETFKLCNKLLDVVQMVGAACNTIQYNKNIIIEASTPENFETICK